ncbi:MAG: protein kinase [Myxococcota bacterium]|nr:protein kinase [Myxococcota bacterium]
MVPPGQDPIETFPRRYDRFELLEKIGEGGMAEVFKAKLPGVAGFEKILVIKRILPHLARNERFVKMFVNEAQIAAQLLHHNIVQVSELGQTESGELFIAMEYVPGIDLRGILRNAARRLIRIPVWFTVHTISQVCGGLAHAHELTDNEGKNTMVIHRDVTPSNVFISKNGDVKLADFGIAKAVGKISETRVGQLKGKISYMPPEQLHGEALDPRADVFSAGVVLWECLTQRRLFGGRPDFETMLAICEGEREPPSKHNPKIPPELDEITLRALEPDRANRTTSARELQEQLLQVMPLIRPALLPGDIRHVVKVLTGETEPDPEYGADLPNESGIRRASSISSTPHEPVSLTPSGAPSLAPSITPVSRRSKSSGVSTPPANQPRAPLTPSQKPQPAAHGAVSHAPLVDDIDFAKLKDESDNSIVGNYNGPFPFFLSSNNQQINGPLAYDEMLHASDPRKSQTQSVSCDKKSWIPIEEFAKAAGLDFLTPNSRSLPNVVLVSRLSDRSLVYLLSRLALSNVSGRLLLMRTSPNAPTTRREIDIVNGAPSFVYTDQMNMQTPALLVRRDIISEPLVPEIIHTVLKEQTHLAQVVQQKIGVDVGRHRAVLMRDRFIELFEWKKGRIAFSEGMTPRESRPFANSLLTLLFDGIHRTWSREKLTSHLRVLLEKRWSPSSNLFEVLERMELTDGQIHAAQKIIDGRPVSQTVKKSPADSMVVLVMFYLLVEMDLLVERR